MIEEKVERYLDLALARSTAFRVLFVLPSVQRLAHVRARIAKKTGKVFFLATFADLKAHGPWARIWQRPSGERKTL